MSVGDGLHRVLANRDLAARAIGRGPWWSTVKQVHGAEIVVAHPTAGRGPAGRHREADGQWTEDTEPTLAVLSADCVLVLAVGDAGRIGVAHAGWRGIVAGVVENIVRATQAVPGLPRPGHRPCCFEVGAEVRGEFAMRWPETGRRRAPRGSVGGGRSSRADRGRVGRRRGTAVHVLS